MWRGPSPSRARADRPRTPRRDDPAAGRGAPRRCSWRAARARACRLLPDVALRQWVLTVPNEIRRAPALRPYALTAQSRIFVEELARWQKQKAAALGILGAE